ncbi:hypothetical protein LIAUS_14830 [Leptospira interrogans]
MTLHGPFDGSRSTIELPKNFIAAAATNKTASIDHFMKQKQDGELIIQQL